MRERLMVSFFLALLVHLVAFLVLQQLVRLQRPLERIGPIVVELAEVPVPAVIREQPAEPRRAPAPQSTQSMQPVQSTQPQSAPAAAPSPAAAPTSRPRVAPGVPTPPQPQPEQTPVPRPSTRTESRVLPAAPTGTESPPTVRSPQPPVQQPAWNQPVPVPEDREVRPEAGPGAEPSSKLDLSRLDRALGGEAAGTGTTSGGTSGPAAAPGAPAAPAAGGTSGPAKDYAIEWARPEQGREAVSTPRPTVPRWVSEKGMSLQVTASFVLTPEGLLRDVQVERSSGYSDVDAAVLEALRRWRFDAAPPGSREVSGTIRYRIEPR